MLRCVIVCIAVAGCVPVSYSTSPSRIRDAASTLRREGTAVVAVDVDDDPPARDSPSIRKIEVVRLDEPIRVRFGAQPQSAEQTVTVADLFANCPADLDDSDANRLAYPRCKLFRASAIRLHGGHRADKSKFVLAGTLVAAAGDIVCIAECGGRAAQVSLGVGVASAGVGVGVGLIGLLFYELFKNEDLKHGY